jgi:lipopolysaccharide transport system ATP-binding protein
MLSVTNSPIEADFGATNNLNWAFSSLSPSAFDFLAQGETLVLDYTVKVTDSNNPATTDTRLVSITITGSNDQPDISVKSTDLASVSLIETDSGLSSSGHLSIEALRDLDLNIFAGDRLGIVGHNGSGKSTLLRLLSGIYEPSSGSIERSGSIASLVDISLGINGENTGRENIFLRGKLMGLSKKEIDEKIEEIIEFSELGDYINLPVRIYSSGMLLRLAFSVSTSITADILIMDEWLSVGDGAFAERASARLRGLVDESEILIIASHDRDLIEKTCNKVVWLEHGHIKKIGPNKDITSEYFGPKS